MSIYIDGFCYYLGYNLAFCKPGGPSGSKLTILRNFVTIHFVSVPLFLHFRVLNKCQHAASYVLNVRTCWRL